MISNEVAREDVERFLKAFNIDPIKRGKMKAQIDSTIQLVENEMVEVTEGNQLRYMLLEPICNDKGDVLYSSITLKNRRVRVEEIEKLKDGSDTDKLKKLITLSVDETIPVAKLTIDDMMYVNGLLLFFLPAQ